MFCLLLNHDTISNISPYVPSVMSKCLLLFSWEEASTYFPSLLRHLFVIRKQKQKKKKQLAAIIHHVMIVFGGGLWSKNI